MGVGVTWNIKFTDNVAGIGSIEGNKKEVYLQYLGWVQWPAHKSTLTTLDWINLCILRLCNVYMLHSNWLLLEKILNF